MTAYLLVALICYIGYRAMSGADNGLLYSERMGTNVPLFQKLKVHGIEVIETTIVMLGFWAAGLDAMQLTAGWFVASPVFKGFINLGTGRPFVDPEETADVDQDGRPGYDLFGFAIPSLGYGWGRVVLAAAGVVVIVLWPRAMGWIGLDGFYPFDLERAFGLLERAFRLVF